MREQISICILFCMLTGNAMAKDQNPLSDEADRINYTIGHQIGEDFKRQKVQLNEQALNLGLQHGQAGEKAVLDKAEMQELLLDLKRNISNRMKEENIVKLNSRRQIEQQKRDAGNAFMKENQRHEDVKTMPSGMQYRVLKKAKGPKPGEDDYVTFNFRARTVGGKEYDSSSKAGGPITRRTNGVLPGFTEAITMMSPGAKWEIVLPPELAYGRKGPLAHQTIIFEVELLSINK